MSALASGHKIIGGLSTTSLLNWKFWDVSHKKWRPNEHTFLSEAQTTRTQGSLYRQGRPIYCPFSTKKTSAPREPLCMRPCSFRLSVAILFISIPSWIVIRMSISLGFFLSVHIDPIRATRLIPSSFLISPTNHCAQSKRTDRSVRKRFSSNDWIFLTS